MIRKAINKKGVNAMKRFLIAISAVILFACGSNAADVKLYYVPGCPFCDHAKQFFSAELPKVKVQKINVTTGGENMRKFMAELERCNSTSRGVPLIVVNGECIQGFSPDTGARIKTLLGR